MYTSPSHTLHHLHVIEVTLLPTLTISHGVSQLPCASGAGTPRQLEHANYTVICLVRDGGWASTAASNVSGAFGCPVLDYPTYGLCVTRPAGVIKPAHIRTCSYRAGSLTGLRGFLRGLGPSYLFPRAATRLCSPFHNRAGRLEQVTTANA